MLHIVCVKVGKISFFLNSGSSHHSGISFFLFLFSFFFKSGARLVFADGAASVVSELKGQYLTRLAVFSRDMC